MSIFDSNISDLDTLKYFCKEFIRNNFNKLYKSPKFGKVGNIIYLSEYGIPSDSFINPTNYILFWGIGYLPISYTRESQN